MLILLLFVLVLGVSLGVTMNNPKSIVVLTTPAPTQSMVPSPTPTLAPSISVVPSLEPTMGPSGTPSTAPSNLPSLAPSALPSPIPSMIPTDTPNNNFCHDGQPIFLGDSVYVNNVYDARPPSHTTSGFPRSIGPSSTLSPTSLFPSSVVPSSTSSPSSMLPSSDVPSSTLSPSSTFPSSDFPSMILTSASRNDNNIFQKESLSPPHFRELQLIYDNGFGGTVIRQEINNDCASGIAFNAPGRWYKFTGTGTTVTLSACHSTEVPGDYGETILTTTLIAKLQVYEDIDACPNPRRCAQGLQYIRGCQVKFSSFKDKEYLILVSEAMGEFC